MINFVHKIYIAKKISWTLPSLYHSTFSST
jgi:hypothetical protein